jgi:putative ABC transport system permease protein
MKSGTAPSVRLIVKSAAPLREIAATIRQCIRRVDADLSPATVTDMSELVALAVGQPYFFARLFGVLAAMALFLSLGGLYSIVALAVSARSREMAIRCCLGAQRGDIVRLVLGEAAISVGIGIALGGLGAVAVQRRMGALVYGVESTDSVVTIAGSAVLLSTLALVAVYVAVRRVPDVRPMDLLRNGAGALA